MSNKGRNPFDRTTSLPKDTKPSKSVQQVVEWERIRAAQNVAGQQKARTRAALSTVPVAPPQEVPHLANPVVVPPAVPATSKPSIQWNGMNIWRAVCLILWVVLSLAAFAGNFFGGLIISIVLFFVINLLAQAPSWVSSVSLEGGRDKKGKAV
jgi:hypothetical protein